MKAEGRTFRQINRLRSRTLVRRRFNEAIRRYDRRRSSRAHMEASESYGFLRYHRGSGLIHKGRKP